MTLPNPLAARRPLAVHPSRPLGLGQGVGACLVMAGLAAHPAAAQRADPAFSGNVVPQGSPISRILPPAPPATSAAPSVGGPAVPRAVPAATVNVQSVALAGVTAFTTAQTAAVLRGLTGPAVTLAAIEQARTALVSLYRSHGYVLTTVNAEIAAGFVLRFNVVEGRVVDVKLDGDIGPAGVQVLRFLRHLTQVQPLDNASLERWLLLAQDVPGITLHAVLRPSADDPGALTLLAQVSHTLANGLLTVDNRANRQTGPQEALLVLDLNSLTQLGEQTEASVYHTNGDTQNFGQVSTEFFAGGSGLRVRVYAGTGKATPSDFLRAIDYQGFTDTFGIAAIYPVIRARQQTLNASVNLDAVESEIRSDSGPTGQETRASRDSYRILRFGADYARGDILLGGGRPANSDISVRVSHGLSFLGGTGNANPLPGRPGENLDFTAASFDLSRSQTLFVPWQEASVVLKTEVLAQVTGDVLPPAEKFFLGGTAVNRGYYAGQVTGDNGITGSAELDLNTAVRIVPYGHPISLTGQFYVFYDDGRTWENTDADPDERLSSEGIGARIDLTRYAEFDIEGDIRNNRLPSGTQGEVRPLKADALYWRVLARF